MHLTQHVEVPLLNDNLILIVFSIFAKYTILRDSSHY